MSSWWSENVGGGNSFTESVANVFTFSDGASYVGGTLTYDSGSNAGTVVQQNNGGGFGSDDDGKAIYSGSANNTTTNSDNISGGTNNNFVFKGTAPSSSGVNKLLGFANPFSVIGKIAGWAAGIDPEVDDKKVVDGQQIYTKTGEGGMSYSYNFLGMPYEVDVVGNKVVDKLS
ncbi:MAG TPA: hypothetical protein DCX27_01445, partial [Balneola sp.]|nr:hypothetical protein [Balneola sp.]